MLTILTPPPLPPSPHLSRISDKENVQNAVRQNYSVCCGMDDMELAVYFHSYNCQVTVDGITGRLKIISNSDSAEGGPELPLVQCQCWKQQE